MKINRILLSITSLLMMMSVSHMTYAGVPNVVNTKVTYEKFFQEDKEINLRGQLDISKLLTKDLSIKKTTSKPQILIINSHPQETYKSNEGSVIDIGSELEKVLEANYQVSVLHYKDTNNKGHLVGAYEYMEPLVENILKENPSIEVIIDVHRDGGMEPTATLIDEKSTATINIVNGLSMDESSGKIGSSKTYPNVYVEDNLSFSTQMKYNSDELAPKLISSIVIKPFRYNLHMEPKSLLINIGNNNDTLEEAANAVYPFTEVLAEVLNLEKIVK